MNTGCLSLFLLNITDQFYLVYLEHFFCPQVAADLATKLPSQNLPKLPNTMDVPPSSIKLENVAIKSEPLDTSSLKLEPGAIKNEPVDSMTPIKTEPGSVKADPGLKQEMDIKPPVSSNSRYVMVCCRYLSCH